MDFNNKVILITGASTGIGNAIGRQLANQNVKLAIVARRENLLREIAEDEENILAIKCNVGNKDEVASAYKEIIDKFGKIDIAILNAGYSVRMTVENYNSKLAEEIFGANLFGIIYWVEQLIPELIKRKEGIIVGVSSLADSKGYSKSGFYSASKAAATIYLEGLTAELKQHNIKVLTVRPGFVRTPMTDKNEFEMPFMMEPEEAADIILNGIRKEKRMIQFPWPIVLITRLIPLIPTGLYDFLERLKLKRDEKNKSS